MSAFLILLVLIFIIVLMAIEIPKMLSNKLNKSNNELWTFLTLLMSGAILQILKILKVNIPNPSDAIQWVYSPVIELIKNFFK